MVFYGIIGRFFQIVEKETQASGNTVNQQAVPVE
jgi:hypothetical protein